MTDEVTFDPRGQGRAAIENEILGDLESPDWERYRKAHLWHDPDNAEKKAGYKLIIARMHNGRLQVIWRQLVNAVAVLNGARGGVNIPAADKQGAWNHAMRYYTKQGIAREDQPEFTGALSMSRAVFSRPVQLLAGREVDLVDTADAKWVHVASEGDYPGYDNGERPFEFTRELFGQMVANLHRNASYKADASGVGSEDVVPWDFHHASELFPAAGSIPTQGAPAQAWSREFEVRNGPDGEAQLWALTRFLDLARGYIKKGQYKWASLAVTFNYIDPATNENIGAVVTSIALTNQPIIQGLDQLAASRRKDVGKVAAGRYGWYEAAECAEDAMGSLKELFGLPEMTGAPEVIGELTKLQQWVTQGGTPLGVDVGEIISRMRTIFNLPALSTETEVLAEAGKVIQRLLEEQAIDQGQPAVPVAPLPEGQPAPTAATPVTTAAAAKEMDMSLLKILAGKLGVREADAEVIAAVEDLVTLRTGSKAALEAPKDTTKVILEAAKEAMSARERLSALVTALGVEDPNAAVEKIAELMKQASDLKAAMPELESLRTQAKQHEDAQAETDVTEVMNSRGYSDEVKDALLLFRKSDPEKFKEKYPKAAVPRETENTLLSSLVVTTKGVELRPQTQQATASRAPGQSTVIPLGSDVINLATYPGRNITERAMSYIRANVQGAGGWKHEDLFVAACELKKQPNVVDQVIQ